MVNSDVSTIDLILLGLIKNQPMSPYDMSKISGIYELVKISVPAIYRNVHRLQNSGFLKSRREKKSNMPEKTIYTITAKGEKRFQDLLLSASSVSVDFYFDFNVPLLFVNSVDKKTGIEIIERISLELQSKYRYLDEQLDKYKDMPFPIVNLGTQHLELNRLLLEWIKDFKKKYIKLNKL